MMLLKRTRKGKFFAFLAWKIRWLNKVKESEEESPVTAQDQRIRDLEVGSCNELSWTLSGASGAIDESYWTEPGVTLEKNRKETAI